MNSVQTLPRFCELVAIFGIFCHFSRQEKIFSDLRGLINNNDDEDDDDGDQKLPAESDKNGPDALQR